MDAYQRFGVWRKRWRRKGRGRKRGRKRRRRRKEEGGADLEFTYFSSVFFFVFFL